MHNFQSIYLQVHVGKKNKKKNRKRNTLIKINESEFVTLWKLINRVNYIRPSEPGSAGVYLYVRTKGREFDLFETSSPALGHSLFPKMLPGCFV